MNTKNNKRRRQSREKIEKVFIEMLQTKELQQISVSDICKAAKLNRSTFYANYLDIYDLADKISEQLVEQVKELYIDEQQEKFNSNDYLRLFRHIKENQLFYKTFFKLGYDNNVEMLYDSNLAQQHFNNKFIDYHIEFFKSGFNAIVKKWLERGCIETPEGMEEIIKSEYQGRKL